MNKYLSIITLNVNGLNVQIKRHRVAECEAGCSQEEGPKKGFVMGSRTEGVQEMLEKYI